MRDTSCIFAYSGCQNYSDCVATQLEAVASEQHVPGTVRL